MPVPVSSLEVPVPVSAGRGACAPLRPCGGAARPAERCGATSSAEQEETVIYKRFLPDLSCLLSNEGALSITHPAEWKNTGTASSLLGRGEPKGRGVGEEGPCRRHGGGARAGRRPRAGGEGRAGAGQRPPGSGRRLGGAAPGRPPSPAAAAGSGSGSGAVPSRPEGPGPRPAAAAAGRERSEGSQPLISSRYFSFPYIFLIVIFYLYTKSALITEKASRGAVTAAACPCSGPWLCSAPAFLPGPPGDWTLEPVPLCQALGTGLLPEPSAAGGGNTGAWSGRCLGGWDIPALPCRLTNARSPAPGSPGRSGRTKRQLTFCEAPRGTTNRRLWLH
ncbi:translation initiation factor IF-2-like [Motacilla alba alba]|uniref:translation initiation factor IF-2-like n=1 Tax=Motacilla alba alba TaxID=1094192 RepID=UPI0018D527CD|nr:translation initiation factor IF-2-like [Motacilla alba alba]